MNPAEFVEESLTEILSSIRAAQAKDGGGLIAAESFAGSTAQARVFLSGSSGAFTVV